MGCKIGDLIISHPITIEELSGKKLAIDANNMLYQFLTTIRQPDGAPLLDSHGRVTSHLQGLFARTTRFISLGLKPAFVFDGKHPELKKTEIEKRARAKKLAMEKYELAKSEQDTEGMAKYYGRTAILTKEMVEESKKLITALGCPVIQSPSEGEATAAYIVNKGLADTVVTQDADALLFGARKVVRNLSIEGRRKKAKTLAFTKVVPELIDLEENLKNLGITQNQLIALGILVGTDFNPGGIHGIGPKKGLKLVKEYKNNFDKMFKDAGWNYDVEWDVIFDIIKKMPVEKNIDLKWKDLNVREVTRVLCDEHSFDKERVMKKLDEIQSDISKGQKGLGEWF